MLENIWNYEVAIIQMIALIALFEFPSIFRRLLRFAYTPMYFMFFPLGHADHLYAKYFAEDYFLEEGADLSEHELAIVKKRITAISIVSSFISAIVMPVFVGLIAAYFIKQVPFRDFLVLLTVMKITLLSFSFFYFCSTSIGSTWRRRLGALIMYATYLAVIIFLLFLTYTEVSKMITMSGGRTAIYLIAKQSLFYFILPIVIFPCLMWAFANLFANPDIRAANLSSNNE